MRILFLMLSLLAAPCFAAKVYQWRDSSGNVYYSDQAPPATNAKQRTIRPNVIGNASQVAATDNKSRTSVVLWIMQGCGQPCDDAVALLDTHQLSYDVKMADPNKESSMLEFFNVVGTMQQRPPVLQIGKDVLKDFNSAAWHAALNKAGYPRNK